MESQTFYRVLLPILAACNLALGLVTLGGLRPAGWIGAVEMATGAVCCAIGGGLVGAAVSKTFWSRAMRRQIGVWMSVSDALLGWLDESPMSDEALLRLRRSVDDALVGSRPGR